MDARAPSRSWASIIHETQAWLSRQISPTLGKTRLAPSTRRRSRAGPYSFVLVFLYFLEFAPTSIFSWVLLVKLLFLSFFPFLYQSSGYVKLPKNSAEALETALATVGPVAVTVAANWATYGGGIFSGGCADIPGYSCSLDHAVVAVGYASDYWLVRNSWGAGWGEKGYIRLSREYDNTTFTDTHPIEGDACVPYPSRQVRVVETEDA